MNNLYLKYIFVVCLVLFLILYFTYPKIKKSLKEKFGHIVLSTTSSCDKDCACGDVCTKSPTLYGSDGTYSDCHDKCMQ